MHKTPSTASHSKTYPRVLSGTKRGPPAFAKQFDRDMNGDCRWVTQFPEDGLKNSGEGAAVPERLNKQALCLQNMRGERRVFGEVRLRVVLSSRTNMPTRSAPTSSNTEPRL